MSHYRDDINILKRILGIYTSGKRISRREAEIIADLSKRIAELKQPPATDE